MDELRGRNIESISSILKSEDKINRISLLSIERSNLSDTNTYNFNEKEKSKKSLKCSANLHWTKISDYHPHPPRSSYSSMSTLPPLTTFIRSSLLSSNITFSVNGECTSLCLPPSGRHILAGFTDGTLRLFDITGRFVVSDYDASCLKEKVRKNQKQKYSDNYACSKHDADKCNPDKKLGCRKAKREKDRKSMENEEIRKLFDCYSSEDDVSSSVQHTLAFSPCINRSKTYNGINVGNKKKSPKILSLEHSNLFQPNGLILCQIHARGVYTSLLMDVAVAEDGLFVFGGVLRGSTELVAVYLGNVEHFHDQCDKNIIEIGHVAKNANNNPISKNSDTVDVLDLIKIYRHSDAKLKGFGACTRIYTGRLEYRLFTGKGIKNIHVWSFIPHLDNESEPSWSCLYDTPTNGNTITHLQFRHDLNDGILRGISKSDVQKIRVWDLSHRDGLHHGERKNNNENLCSRPKKKPPHVDVPFTEDTLGVFGSYAFTGGNDSLGVVKIDADDVQSPFNRSEIALPGVNIMNGITLGGEDNSRRASRSGRKQRGDLRSVIRVAGLVEDAGHVVLELSDGSLLHYSHDESDGSSGITFFTPHQCHMPHGNCSTRSACDSGSRKLCVSRIGSEGLTVLAISSYDASIGYGFISLEFLRDNMEFFTNEKKNEVARGFWGFHGALDFSLLNHTKKADTKEVIGKNCTEILKDVNRKDALLTGSRFKSSISHSSLVIDEIEKDLGIDIGQLSKYNMNKSLSDHNFVEICDNKKFVVTPDLSQTKKKKENTLEKEGNLSPLFISSTRITPIQCKIMLKPKVYLSFDDAEPMSKMSGKSLLIDNTMKNNSFDTKAFVTTVSPEQLGSVSSIFDNTPNRALITRVKQGKRGPIDSYFNLQHKMINKINKEECAIIKTNKRKCDEGVQNNVSIEDNNNDHLMNLNTLPTRLIEGKNFGDQLDISNFGEVNKNAYALEHSVKSSLKLLPPPNIVKLLQELDKISAQSTKLELSANRRASCSIHDSNKKLSQTTCLKSCRLSSVRMMRNLHDVDRPISIEKEHEIERKTMALHNHASHERFRNVIKGCAERIMNVVTSVNASSHSFSNMSSFPDKELRHSIETLLDDTILKHKEMLVEILDRQKMDASAIAARQTIENGGRKAPELKISFPFPEVFSQIRGRIIQCLYGKYP